jgi:hypothetical protein
MHLVEIFLPVNTNEGTPQPSGLFNEVREELLDKFGGVTAFSRNPAEGVWDGPGDGPSKDIIVIYEVMTETLDMPWWQHYKTTLVSRFQQEDVLIRYSDRHLI